MNRISHAATHREALDRSVLVDPFLSNRIPSVVRQIRTALGMSLMDLGSRVGLSHNRIGQLEAQERSNTVQLAWLMQAAEAMECDLAYTFIPKAGSFQAIVDERAKTKAETLDVDEDEAIRRYDFWRD